VIAEYGSHSELMSKKGIYYNLVINQERGQGDDKAKKVSIKQEFETEANNKQMKQLAESSMEVINLKEGKEIETTEKKEEVREF